MLGVLGPIVGLVGAILGDLEGHVEDLGGYVGDLGSHLGKIWGNRLSKSKKQCKTQTKVHLGVTTLERHASEVDFVLRMPRIFGGRAGVLPQR